MVNKSSATRKIILQDFPLNLYLSPMLFVTFQWIDALDILLVSFLLFQLYSIVKGTPAVNIFTGIFFIYLVWIIVRAFDMKLFGSILGKFIDVGVIAIIIVFQQEIRKFLLFVGTNEFLNRNKILKMLIVRSMRAQRDFGGLISRFFSISSASFCASVLFISCL